MKVFLCVNSSRIALSYVKQTFNVQLYQEIVTRMTEAWLVIYISVEIIIKMSYFLLGTPKKLLKTVYTNLTTIKQSYFVLLTTFLLGL